MATYSRVKTFVANETLTASDLNAEFNNIITNTNSGNLNSDNVSTSSAWTWTGYHTYSTSSRIALSDDIYMTLGNATDGDYRVRYNATSTALEIMSTDSDGAGTDAVVLDIQDGTDDLRLRGGFSTDNNTAPTSGIVTGGNIVSDTDSTDDLGTTSVRWANLYVDDITVTNNVAIGGTLSLTGGLTLNGNVTVGDNASDTLTINSTITSNLLFTDNTYDIGASGATRPRDLFLSRNAVMGGTLGVTGLITASGGVSGTTATFTGALTGTTGRFATTGTGDVVVVETSDDTNTAGPVLCLLRESTSPADGDYLGQIKFKGRNDAGQQLIYAKITAKTSDVTDGTEESLIETAVKAAGSNRIVSRQKHDCLQLVNGTGLDVNGVTTLEDALNGTTASFSGAVNANNLVLAASNSYPILFENQDGTTADAAISTYDDANGTLLALGSNFYYNSGAEARFNTSEEASAIVLNRTGIISLRTSDGSNNTVERVSVGNTGDFTVGSAGATGDFAVWTDGTSSTAAGFTVDASADEVIVGQLSGGGNTTFKVRNRLNNTVFSVLPDAPSTTVFAPNIATGSAGTLTVKTGSINSDSIRLEAGGTTSTWLESRGYLGHSWYVDSTRSMTLDSTGLGIGTSSPSGVIHADAASGVDGPIFDSGGTGNTNHALLVRDSGNNQLFRVNNDGNCGIGTSSPVALSNQTSLTVNGTSIGRVDLKAGGSGGGVIYGSSAEFAWAANSGMASNFYGASGQPIRYFIASNEVARFTQSNGSGALTLKSNAGQTLVHMGPEGSGGTEEYGFITGYKNGTQTWAFLNSGPSYINTGQNFGIGTSSPTHTLSLSTTGTDGIKLGVDSQTYYHIVRPNGDGLYLGADDGNTGGSGADIRFAVKGTEIARMLDTGGITFNGDTATANALDDYEEGTWTPVLTFGTTAPSSVSYGTRLGGYTKIGNMVFVTIDLTVSSYSGGSGSFQIQGLPFNTDTANGRGTASGRAVYGVTYTSSISWEFTGNRIYAGHVNTDLQQSAFSTSGFRFIISGVYRAS